MANGNKFQTNRAGIIKSPKPADQPKADVKKGHDLRSGK